MEKLHCQSDPNVVKMPLASQKGGIESVAKIPTLLVVLSYLAFGFWQDVTKLINFL